MKCYKTPSIRTLPRIQALRLDRLFLKCDKIPLRMRQSTPAKCDKAPLLYQLRVQLTSSIGAADTADSCLVVDDGLLLDFPVSRKAKERIIDTTGSDDCSEARRDERCGAAGRSTPAPVQGGTTEPVPMATTAYCGRIRISVYASDRDPSVVRIDGDARGLASSRTRTPGVDPHCCLQFFLFLNSNRRTSR